jgi:hypothetical protein
MPHHAHSIDRWDDATGSNLYEHLAGVNDLRLALATFEAAVKRWPGAKITLRNGAVLSRRHGRRTTEGGAQARSGPAPFLTLPSAGPGRSGGRPRAGR